MKYLHTFSFLLICFLVSSCSTNAGQSNESSTNMVLAPAEFEAALQASPQAQLIDVRTPTEFNAGALAASKNFNVKDAAFESQMATLNKEQPVFVYCQGGVRSAKAASQLKEMGFEKVYDLKGGYRAWKKAGK